MQLFKHYLKLLTASNKKWILAFNKLWLAIAIPKHLREVEELWLQWSFSHFDYEKCEIPRKIIHFLCAEWSDTKNHWVLPEHRQGHVALHVPFSSPHWCGLHHQVHDSCTHCEKKDLKHHAAAVRIPEFSVVNYHYHRTPNVILNHHLCTCIQQITTTNINNYPAEHTKPYLYTRRRIVPWKSTPL